MSPEGYVAHVCTGAKRVIVDMHVHTRAGSADSQLAVDELIDAVRAAGLGGIVVAEHVRQWDPDSTRQLSERGGVRIFPAAEWSCEYGHVVVLGVSHETKFTGPLREMRRIVHAQGGFMILAHPFRYFPGPMNLLFGKRPEAREFDAAALARHAAFALVDEIESLNNGCTDRENTLAGAVACALGRRGVGGSDAHAAGEVGRCVTEFQDDIESVGDLIRELRRGRFRAARSSAPWICA
ncbi:MAG TPA: PHP-associated domain-containing protein [Dehalococcoidia bacterium]|nr:PHP-associated domain-containing protein [Dehalococcoidia bacterium]